MPNPKAPDGFSYRPHPHLYEINTWVWLEQLSADLGRPIALHDVPDEQWERLQKLGFDFVYLMGVARLEDSRYRRIAVFDPRLQPRSADWNVR
jgi:hypothetical protein